MSHIPVAHTGGHYSVHFFFEKTQFPYKIKSAKNLVPAHFETIFMAAGAPWLLSAMRFPTHFCPAAPQGGPYGFSGAKISPGL